MITAWRATDPSRVAQKLSEPGRQSSSPGSKNVGVPLASSFGALLFSLCTGAYHLGTAAGLWGPLRLCCGGCPVDGAMFRSIFLALTY